jgi:3',5'-cyclic AMP phosphodiesterase CpdA
MSTASEKYEKLRDFFRDAFKVSELDMFLKLNGFAEVAGAVNPNAPGIHYVFEVVEAMDRRGLVDAAFFDRLSKERPAKEDQIKIVRRMWIDEVKPSAKSLGGATSSPSRKETAASAAKPRDPSPIADDDAQPITLLHVSDMQFGRYHRFGRLGAYDPDASFDTLLQRLTDDLDGLKQDHNLIPQIVVASGDLAEWGLPGEFEQAREFLDRVAQHLELGHERIIIVPGNHDINRKASQAHFLMAEAKGKAPIPPFWPKWEDYAEMFKNFYGGPTPGFTVAEPWTWYEIPDLKVAVAGLNSTISEIHNIPETDPKYDELIKSGAYGHFGRIGEEQLRWFAGKLKPIKERGTFRIGVVHHNVLRGAVDDDENLRDADRLGQFLGGSLNLLLHGHTHDSKIRWLNPNLPVLSTGSAALLNMALPENVPNQYQVVRIWPDRLERWTRRFEPDQKHWVGDTRCSDDGNSWHVVHPVAFVSVQDTFPTRPRPRTPNRRRPGGRSKPSQEDQPDPRDFADRDRLRAEPGYSSRWIARVAEVCRLRDKHVTDVREMEAGDPPMKYLLVTTSDEMSVQQYPLGVFERPVTAADLAQFVRAVVQTYRAADPRLNSTIVYAGEQVSPGLKASAKREGVRLFSLIEYQGLMDLGDYSKRQMLRIEADPIYPRSLYVPQRMTYRIGVGASVLPENPSGDVLDTVAGWLTDEDGRFVLVLANFGHGKTFLLRELTRRLTELPGGPIPILIEMRALQRARTLDELIAQHLVAAGEETFDTKKFRYMLEKGRVALLFDGFDELAQRVSYASATDHFDTLLQAAAGQAKVIVTSRTHHFESDDQVRTALLQKAEFVPGLRLCHLKSFDEGQIRAFLDNLLGDPQQAEERFRLIHDVKDLLGLSETPRMLSFIAELPADQLREARDRLGKITSAELYRLLLRRWLEFDVERDQPKGAAPTLTAADR